jgi:hypothetical protein
MSSGELPVSARLSTSAAAAFGSNRAARSPRIRIRIRPGNRRALSLRMPERLDEQEPADWRAGRDALYQLAALTIGARLAVVDA